MPDHFNQATNILLFVRLVALRQSDILLALCTYAHLLAKRIAEWELDQAAAEQKMGAQVKAQYDVVAASFAIQNSQRRANGEGPLGMVQLRNVVFDEAFELGWVEWMSPADKFRV